MNLLVELLINDRHSLVIENNRVFRTFDTRGVSTLFQLLQTEPQLLDGARVADKVVGKGAAALMLLGKVHDLYALTISKPALAMLHDYGMEVTYEKLVDNIINRAGDDICPVEKLCMDCETPEQALPLIASFLEKKG